jgi:acyl-coenzyme A synthetase/AMP-(fatty) acid ligase
LLIHKELLGSSKSFDLDGDWYKTGDIVESFDDDKFKFQSRRSDIINVGGYKVNPEEIENIVKAINGVVDVTVFGRKNSIMGNIVAAHIIKEDSYNSKVLKAAIRETVIGQLQEFKVPRIIKFVESFELTRTGKIKK